MVWGTRTRRGQNAGEVEQGDVLGRATRIADSRSIVGDKAEGFACVRTDVGSYRVRIAARVGWCRCGRLWSNAVYGAAGYQVGFHLLSSPRCIYI